MIRWQEDETLTGIALSPTNTAMQIALYIEAPFSPEEANLIEGLSRFYGFDLVKNYGIIDIDPSISHVIISK